MNSVPYIAMFVAYLFVYLPRQFVTLEMRKLQGGYDNRDPRGQQAKLEGLGRRALAAHQNGFEAFAPFAAGVLASIQRGADSDVVAYLSIAFIAARAIYIYAYLANRSLLRSIVWSFGMVATGSLLIVALVGR